MPMTPTQKPGVKFIAGFPISIPNTTYDGDGFYISHNSRDVSTYGDVTTALVVLGNGTAFYVLNGDHRVGYAHLIAKGLDACLDYFRANIDKKNKYSEDLPTPAGPVEAK